MKALLLIITILPLATTSYAADFFTDTPLEQIKIVEVQENSVIARSNDGNMVSAQLGDFIGSKFAEIVEIDPTSIVVNFDQTRLRMPVLSAIHTFLSQ